MLYHVSATEGGATAQDGDYWLESGTDGTQDAIYTNGTFFILYMPSSDFPVDSAWWIASSRNPTTYINKMAGASALTPVGTYMMTLPYHTVTAIQS